MSLTAKVILAMLLGIVVGLAINLLGLNTPGSFVQSYVVGAFDVVGKLFLTALKMLVVPLVFFSLISGVLGIGDVRKLGSVGAKSFGFYMLTTALAITVAITVAVTFAPGSGVESVAPAQSFEASKAPPLSEVLLGIVPSNIVEALAQGNMLQIIFFAILFGISLLMVEGNKKGIEEGVEVLNEAMMKMVTIVMATAPYAVFALLAKAMSELGLELLTSLLGYVLVLVGVLVLHLLGTLMLLFKLFTGLSIRTFLAQVRDAQLFAFSTSSSGATIPITLRCVTKGMGVNNSIASFSVPFGATINMDGTAIMQGVATVFIANVYGIELGLSEYLTVILMSVLASIGTAGVPGVGLIMLSMVFVQVGLPVEGIGLILGVDRLIDMMRTAVNVTGDAVVSCVVAKSEDALDEEVFNDIHTGDYKEPSLEDTKPKKRFWLF